MRAKRRWRAHGVVLAFLLVGPAVAAEESPPPAPQALAFSALPRRAGEDERLLSRLRDSLLRPPRAEDAAVASALPRVSATLADLAVREARRDGETPGLPELLRARTELLAQERRLAGWEEELETRCGALERAGATLAGMRAAWEPTRLSAEAGALPPALAGRVSALLASIAEIDAERSARLVPLLGLLDRVSRERGTADALLERLSAAEGEVRVARFAVERAPLWVALGSSAAEPSALAQFRADWNQRAIDLADFAARNRARIWLHAAFCAALLVALLLLRRGAGSAEPMLARAPSCALLLALACTRLVYPVHPFVVIDLVVLLGLVPLLRLLPPSVDVTFRAPLYGLAALFASDRLAGLADERTVLHRLLLLAISAAGVGCAAWVLRRAAQVDGRWPRVVRALAGLGGAIFGAAIVADLVGAVALARLLTRGTLIATYAALVLLTGGRVLEALIARSLRSRALRSLRMLHLHLDGTRRWSVRIVRIVLLLSWARLTLAAYAIDEPVGRLVRAALSREWRVGTLAVSAADLLAFVVALVAGLVASRLIPLAVQEDVLSRTRLPFGTRGAIALLVRYGILALALLAAVAAAGIELAQFAIVAGALGVGIGFGLQGLVYNFVSGLILAFERPVRLGDLVQVGELLGSVLRIGVRASVIRTRDGAEVIVPNGDLLSNRVINWTLTDRRRRMEIPVGVAYGTDPQRVLELLGGVAEANPRVLASPPAQPLFLGFGESSLDFTLRYWVAEAEEITPLRSELALAVHAALRDAGIEVPFPQRDVHLRGTATETPARETVTERRP